MSRVHACLCLSLMLVVGCGSPRDERDSDSDSNGNKTFSAQFVSPAENASICGTTNVEATVSNGTAPVSVTFLVDGETLQSVKEPPYRASLDTTQLAAGKHILSLIAVDAKAQTIGASHAVTVVLDGECDNPPVIAFDSSTPTRASQLVIPLQVAATDDVGIAKVQFFTGATLFAELTEPPFEVNWDPRPFGAGTYELKAMAFDTKNQTATATHPITIDREAPMVVLTSPTSGQSVTSPVELVASVSKQEELSRIDFFVGTNLVGHVLSSPFEITVSSLTAGTYKAHAEVWDVLGNTSSSTEVSFTVTGGSGSCSGRCDCTGAGQICVAGKCQQAPSDGSCLRDDQCPLGSICDFNRECVPGCAADCECSGGKACNLTTLQCEVTAAQCTTKAQCSAGQVCKSGACSACATNTDCKVYSTTARCGSNGLCAEPCTDMRCQSQLNSTRGYCDTATNTCELYECVSDADCIAPDVCDLSQHACTGGSICSASCNGKNCAGQGMVCDTASCTCVANLCDPANAGTAVKPDCSACDLNTCIVGGCVDAANTSHTCALTDSTACLIGAITGIFTCN